MQHKHAHTQNTSRNLENGWKRTKSITNQAISEMEQAVICAQTEMNSRKVLQMKEYIEKQDREYKRGSGSSTEARTELMILKPRVNTNGLENNTELWWKPGELEKHWISLNDKKDRIKRIRMMIESRGNGYSEGDGR